MKVFFHYLLIYISWSIFSFKVIYIYICKNIFYIKKQNKKQLLFPKHAQLTRGGPKVTGLSEQCQSCPNHVQSREYC